MPYLNMFYPDSLTAYSSKWTGVNPSLPTEGGVFGLAPYIWNYITMTSSTAVASTSTTQSVQVGGGISVWLYGIIGAVLIVIAAVIILTIRKKRRNE
jgi:hypothetical protein